MTKMRNSRTGRGVVAIIAAMTAPLACSDATDVELLEISGTGVLFGQAFLDFDGTGSFTVGDEPVSDVDVVLITSSTAEVVDLATTDSLGVFILFEVPVGSYRLTLDSMALGDSLEILGANDPITVALGDTSLVNLGVTFPVLSLEEALVAPLGSRVFTSGIALNPRLNFDPTGQVHFAGDSLFLRALNVERAGISPGDSLRILGRVVSDNGRPALDEVTPFVLVGSAALVIPEDVSAAVGALADAGRLDAALVRVRDVEMTDTSTALDGHFRFWAVEGADSIEVVIRDFLGLNTSAFRPDTILRIDRAIGLLSPFDDGSGTVRWRLLPRGGTDVFLETKVADVSVGVALDTTQASLGDTVEITVVAENNGPLTATGVEVRDTIPTALSFLSASQTTGTYDSGTGIWSLGDLANGSSDTLRVLVEVSDGTPAIVGNVAESLGLTFEVDGDGGNNGFVVFLTIS